VTTAELAGLQGRTFADISFMPDYRPPQLGRLIGLPIAAIGVLAAVLTWELEHVGSVLLAFLIAAGGISVCVIVGRRVRAEIDTLAEYYETLLRIADEQSRRAETANRLKDDFLATLSHELRTPLNSVLGWARLLGSGKLDAPQTEKAIQAIERAGLAQAHLVDDLLDMSRIVGGKLQVEMRPTRLQPLVDAAVQSLQRAADARQITIDTDLDARVGPILGDPDRLRQVAWNLLSNAIKFTPAGGRVRVGVTSDDQQLRLTVSDTGIGLNPDVAEHLFERFRQGDSSPGRRYGGLGLGLGIVRHLIEQHGGTVTAESAGADRGSVFTVRLPIGASVEMPAPALPAQPAPVLDGLSVLLVDDDPQALEFGRSALEQYGASVAVATSAREAHARFAGHPPDVLVSDLAMPGEDGIHLIRAIRALDEEHGGRTPAAALTGLARADDRRRALTAGYQMHVTKPIDPFELASAVQRLARGEDDHEARDRVAS
jgi:signal transduction histidine kinase/ActR/RegA family two-component response regulator